MRNRIIATGFFFFLILMIPVAIHAKKDEHNEEHTEKDKKFDPGTFIIDHVTDAHDWHLVTWNGYHINIPLPVILYSRSEQNKGLHIFMSSEFCHGHKAYKGFKLLTEGENKGDIVEMDKAGHILEKAPYDFSITKNVLELFFCFILLCWIFISVAKRYKKRRNQPPKGLQSMLEPLIIFIRDDVAKAAIGDKKYERFLPFLLTLFFFIFLTNLMGLLPIIPGSVNLTGNISVTGVLALFTFFITIFSGNKNYWKHIFNPPGVPWWLKLPLPLMPLIEFLGMFIKPFVLMVRLFANISAGHIVALGFFSLIFIFGNLNIYAGYGVSPITLIFTIFMTLLELLVAFIQAYVFTLLSALYFGMATEDHH